MTWPECLLIYIVISVAVKVIDICLLCLVTLVVNLVMMAQIMET